MANLVATATTKVGVMNPVEDFKKLLASKEESYSEVCCQLEEVVLKLFKDAMGRAAHSKAVRCLRAYREAALEKASPDTFNGFIKQLKSLYCEDEGDVWSLLVKEDVLPIGKKECELSTLQDDEVERFYATEKPSADKEDQPDKDEDDLLAMM